MRLTCSNGRARAAALAASLVVGIGVTAVPAAGADGHRDITQAQYDAARDHPMGSQVARYEAEADQSAVSAQSTSDDPTSGVQGIDVSRWQGDVDWQSWWDKGKRFAYVKASEGTYNTNPYFDQQYDGSAGVGMTRGAYHFAIPNDSAASTQANFFVDNGGGWARDGKTLPGVIDIEPNPNVGSDGTDDCYGMTKAELADWLGEFATTYHQRTGRYPVIYTVTSWWTACVNSSAFGETSPLWIARWNSEVGGLPSGWTSWTFWQYSTTPVDQDKFAGTAAELRQLADGPAPTAPTSVGVTGGLGRATVRWQEPRWAGVGGVTKYRIGVSPGDKIIDNIPPSDRSHLVTGLPPGVTHTFTLRAYSQDGAGATVSKRLVGVKVSSTLSPTTLTYGSQVKFSGKIYRADTGQGTSGWSVKLQWRKKGTTAWQTLSSGTTGSEGAYSFTVKPSSNGDYRAIYPSGNTVYLGGESAIRPVMVRQAVTGSFSDSSVSRGTTAKFSGSVRPYHVGQTIHLQRYAAGKWTTVASTTLSSTSTYSFSVKHSGAGGYYYRTYKPGHTDHAAGYSPSRKLTVS